MVKVKRPAGPIKRSPFLKKKIVDIGGRPRGEERTADVAVSTPDRAAKKAHIVRPSPVDRATLFSKSDGRYRIALFNEGSGFAPNIKGALFSGIIFEDNRSSLSLLALIIDL